MTGATDKQVPLCVDMDETLLNTDTLVESALQLLKANPLVIFSMFVWLLQGKAQLKQQIARRKRLKPGLLPYNEPFIAWLREEYSNGRELVLITAANEQVARDIADHLGLFSLVLASDDNDNLKAERKRQRLTQLYGAGGYDYAGNSADDLPAWRDSRHAVLVNTTTRVAARARQQATVSRTFPRAKKQLPTLLKAMRPHQWSKNVLIFVSLLVSHSYSDDALLTATALAFVAFCLCSSAVYLINDLLDLEADRRHDIKRKRPFASGALSLHLGVAAIPVLLAVSAAITATLPTLFGTFLSIYFVLTLLYSLYLKRIPLLDVITLSGLYTLRLLAGAAVAVAAPSVWLVSFSLFLFTSLAIAKRYAEIKAMVDAGDHWVGGRGYHVSDLNILGQLGAASGFISTLVLALYIDSGEVMALYTAPYLLWLLCPLLMYWIGRLWLVASRGQLDQDPVIYATRDHTSYIVAALGLFIMLAAL